MRNEKKKGKNKENKIVSRNAAARMRVPTSTCPSRYSLAQIPLVLIKSSGVSLVRAQQC